MNSVSNDQSNCGGRWLVANAVPKEQYKHIFTVLCKKYHTTCSVCSAYCTRCNGNESAINILEITWYMDMKNVTLVSSSPLSSSSRRLSRSFSQWYSTTSILLSLFLLSPSILLSLVGEKAGAAVSFLLVCVDSTLFDVISIKG